MSHGVPWLKREGLLLAIKRSVKSRDQKKGRTAEKGSEEKKKKVMRTQ